MPVAFDRGFVSGFSTGSALNHHLALFNFSPRLSFGSPNSGATPARSGRPHPRPGGGELAAVFCSLGNSREVKSAPSSPSIDGSQNGHPFFTLILGFVSPLWIRQTDT